MWCFLPSHSTIFILFFFLFFMSLFLCSWFVMQVLYVFLVCCRGWCLVVNCSLLCSFTSFPLTLLPMNNNFSHVFLFLVHVVHVHVLFYFLLVVGIGSWLNVGYKCGWSFLSKVFDHDPRCCCLLLPFWGSRLWSSFLFTSILFWCWVITNYIKWNKLSLWQISNYYCIKLLNYTSQKKIHTKDQPLS